MNEIKILLIAESKITKTAATLILENFFQGKEKITHLQLLQDAIELLEKHEQKFNLVVCEYQGHGQALLKVLLEMGKDTSFIACTPDPDSTHQVNSSAHLEYAYITDLELSLPSAIVRLEQAGKIPNSLVPGKDYVAMRPESIIDMSTLNFNVYAKLAEGRYIKLFNKGSLLDSNHFKKYKNNKIMEFLYIEKSDFGLFLREQARISDEVLASETISPKEIEKKAEASLQLTKDLVAQTGFTVEAQAIAKSSVAMAIKAIGNRPKLSMILTDLRNKDGNYITSHSITLGKIACAMAHKIKWSSAATYFKLTLAAFLHDIALQNNRLAEVRSYEAAKATKEFSEEELKIIRNHSNKGAEYALQFNEIPPDVDQIIVQHHERADGSGFPRGLTSRYISPLAALFIIAHQLVDYTDDHPDENLEQFLNAYEKEYSTGAFKKIVRDLRAP